MHAPMSYRDSENADNFVSSRKDGLSVFYKVERQDILEILHLLHGLYCA